MLGMQGFSYNEISVTDLYLILSANKQTDDKQS